MAGTKSKISKTGTVYSFLKGRACSDTLFHVLNRAFDNPMPEEERAAAPLAGGIKQHGYQCGMLWGAALAAGAQAYKLYGPGPKAETRALTAAGRIVKSFKDQNNNHVNCLEITDLDKSSSTMEMVTYFLLKGGSIGCFRRAARYAPVAYREVSETFCEKEDSAACNPANCAAMMAKKAGASEKHAAMAAGLAGGIGLCGGACGALGAAVWILGMKISKEHGIKNLWGDKVFNAELEKLMDTFMKSTDYQFKCSEITGRTFAHAGDHAGYLATGGCAELIKALAEACKSTDGKTVAFPEKPDASLHPAVHDHPFDGRDAA